jgi:hypothetical protein
MIKNNATDVINNVLYRLGNTTLQYDKGLSSCFWQADTLDDNVVKLIT